MGAPLAPVIADIFMAHMETSLMERLEQIGVCEWHRYVDDTFVLLKPGTNIDDVLHVLNEFQPSIQFTHEPEKDNTIAFLDVQVIRTLVENKSEPIDPNEQQAQTFIFDTTIHRKKTFTGLMTNWHSFVPFSYKKSSVVSMIQRALSICSTYSLLDKELLKIRTVCHDNDYPIDFIDTRIGIGLTKYLNRSNNNNNNEPNIPVSGCEKRRMYVEIPFIGKQTEIMKKKISQLTAESRPDLDIRYVAKPPPSVRTLFPTKDPVPIHLQSDVVYAVKCKECGDTYVGKTIGQCGGRLEEHGAPNRTLDRQTNIDESDEETATSNVQSNHNPRPGRATTTMVTNQQAPTLRWSSRTRNKKKEVVNEVTNTKTDRQIEQATTNRTKNENTNVVLSSLAEYEKNTSHHIDWRNTRVLWRDNNPYRLLIKESLVIRAHETQLNRTTQSVPLLVFSEGLERSLIPDPNG